jgi:hypothetical protein
MSLTLLAASSRLGMLLPKANFSKTVVILRGQRITVPGLIPEILYADLVKTKSSWPRRAPRRRKPLRCRFSVKVETLIA